jgi:hypothetical protein
VPDVHVDIKPDPIVLEGGIASDQTAKSKSSPKKRTSPSKAKTADIPAESIAAHADGEGDDVKPDIDVSDIESAGSSPSPTPSKKPRTKASSPGGKGKKMTPKKEASASPKKAKPSPGRTTPGDFTQEKKDRLQAMLIIAGIAVIDQKEVAEQVCLIFYLPKVGRSRHQPLRLRWDGSRWIPGSDRLTLTARALGQADQQRSLLGQEGQH